MRLERLGGLNTSVRSAAGHSAIPRGGVCVPCSACLNRRRRLPLPHRRRIGSSPAKPLAAREMAARRSRTRTRCRRSSGMLGPPHAGCLLPAGGFSRRSEAPEWLWPLSCCREIGIERGCLHSAYLMADNLQLSPFDTDTTAPPHQPNSNQRHAGARGSNSHASDYPRPDRALDDPPLGIHYHQVHMPPARLGAGGGAAQQEQPPGKTRVIDDDVHAC